MYIKMMKKAKFYGYISLVMSQKLYHIKYRCLKYIVRPKLWYYDKVVSHSSTFMLWISFLALLLYLVLANLITSVLFCFTEWLAIQHF